MKKNILVIFTIGFLFSNIIMGQEIPQDNVPSVIVNKFASTYPAATDVEWEMEEGLYKVEFEIGTDIDHDIWYNANGEVVKHKEDIAESELPQAVISKINTEFKGYVLEDPKKTTAGSSVIYELELNSQNGEWEVTIDANGTIIKKAED